MLGGAGSLHAGLAEIILPGLVLVTQLVLFWFLLLTAFLLGLLLAGLIFAGLLATFLLGLLARLLVDLSGLGLSMLDFLPDLSVLDFLPDLSSPQCLWWEEHSSSLWLESDFLGVEVGFFLGC